MKTDRTAQIRNVW